MDYEGHGKGLTMEDKKECTICRGHGLWALGDATPMGPIDASDGLPTKPCPKCGADANPKTTH